MREILTLKDKQQAVEVMMRKREVVEASVSQEGLNITLEVMVHSETSQEKAWELGDRFVRLIKAFGPEELAGKEIGSGTFDYDIIVIRADGSVIAQGSKHASATNITWN